MVWRYARHRLSRIAVPILLLVVPLAVAASRNYRGMHYPTDVLSGALGGALWLTVVLWILMPVHQAVAVIPAASASGAS